MCLNFFRSQISIDIFDFKFIVYVSLIDKRVFNFKIISLLYTQNEPTGDHIAKNTGL